MAIIKAQDGRQPTVQAAVNSAKPGDTVEVPGGQWDWTGSLRVPQQVALQGANTVWRKRDDLGEWKAMVLVDPASDANAPPFRMSGFTLYGRLQDLQGDNRKEMLTQLREQGMVIRGRCKVKIDNCTFTKFIRAGIEFDGSGANPQGTPTGVIYNCSFIDNWHTNLGYGVSIAGHPSAWTGGLAFGTLDNVFVEDCHFDRCRHFVASGNGAKYVARYNTCLDNYQDAAAFDAHGLAGGWPRGARCTEIYRNNLYNSIRRNSAAGIRGGAGVIWGNNWQAGTSQGVSLGIELQLENPGSAKPQPTTYPAQDQIGNPTGLYIWDNTGGVKDLALRPCPWASQPIDYWLKSGRDFHLRPKTNYVPAPYPHPWRS